MRPFSLGSLSRVREREREREKELVHILRFPDVSVDGKKKKNYGEGNKANKLRHHRPEMQ